MSGFNLYPPVNATGLASVLGVSGGCLSSLNATLACNPSTFALTLDPDQYYWTQDNITALCTSSCQQSAVQWNNNVQTACGGYNITLDSRSVPIATVAGRYLDGLNVACLGDGSGGNCLLDSQEWVGSDLFYNSDGSPATEQNLTGMYPSSLLCGSCFLPLLLERLSSPFVGTGGFASYLNYQYYDIQAFCNVTNGTTIPLGGEGFMSVPAANISVPDSGAVNCTGQTVPTTVSSSYQCDTLSKQYSVGTGDLQLASGNVNCSFAAPACAPATCQLGQVPVNSTCDGFAASLFSSSNNITTVQLLTWNPNVVGFCDALPSQYACVAPPGGAYTLQVSNATNAAAGNQGEISTTFSSVAPSQAPCTAGSAAPGPTPNGAISNCCKWYEVQSGDTCYAIWQNNSITSTQFYSWNPEVNQTSCGIWLGYDYCVRGPAVVQSSSTASSVNTVPTSTAASLASGNTQSKITSSTSTTRSTTSGGTTSSQSGSKSTITTHATTSGGTTSAQSASKSTVTSHTTTSGGTSTTHAKRALPTDSSLLGTVYEYLTGRSLLEKRDCSSIATGSCSSTCPCSNGACCSNSGFCGYSPSFCGSGNCTSNCNAKAQCGQYAPSGQQSCPLNVCCSQYGFCGSTDEFCGTGCQTGYDGTCGPAHRPVGTGATANKRAIGYYESWATERPCDQVEPEDLNLSGFTHMNLAFAYFDPNTFQIQAMDSQSGALFPRFTGLKASNPGLQTWISIGGWSFTDPGPTQTAFSNMAASSANRQTFIKNVMQFMKTYGFDGVDVDWEYPAADDRGGVAADAQNYVSLLSDMRAAFGSQYGLSITIPTSYWYMQHFLLTQMEPHVDWFNLMAYDLHGTWDSTDKFVGPYINPHTNLTEIDGSLDLLWRAGVDPSKVVLGEGWYGRSFTLQDPNCNTPNGVCQFKTGGTAGPCSQASGILTNAEIQNVIAQTGAQPVYDSVAGVNWITWNSNQWVSFDNARTYQQKRDLANSRGLGGTMVWAADQDNQNQTTTYSSVPLSPLSLQDKSIVSQLSGGLQATLACYSSQCGDGCRIGYNEIAKMSGQTGSLSTKDQCNSGHHQSECCIGGTKTGKCSWRGYRGHGLPCSGGCNSNEVLITTNTNSITKHGLKTHDYTCAGGFQSLCCAGFSASLNSLNPSYIASSLAAQATNEAKKKAKEVIDKAAGHLCDELVPEILAPIELLELEIPVIGELADLAETIAIPGLIDLCKKELEKAGNAVIGWKGTSSTVSLAQPASTLAPEALCAPETCGTSGTCPNKKLRKRFITDGNEVEANNRHLRRDGTGLFARAGTPLDAPSGSQYDRWFSAVFESSRTAEVLVSEVQGANGEASSDVEGFFTQPFFIGVQGLYGCASLVVVSHSGAYLTHFWEKPNFSRSDTSTSLNSNFRNNILKPLTGSSKIEGFAGIKDLPAGWFTGSDTKIALVVPTNREASSYRYPVDNAAIINAVAQSLGVAASSILTVPYDNNAEDSTNMGIAAGKVALTYGNNIDGSHAAYQVYIGSPTNGQGNLIFKDQWVRGSNQ